ncbi:MAG: 3-deoxy-manno-octulosonate cytidylyltransferase [Pseudomonadota bacterium]
MSRFWIVIPARYASSRYPGKPLVPLRGATGVAKSLIQRAWEAAMAVPGAERVLVATDDDRIAEAAQAFGAEVAMTSEACRNGTERCAEVAAAAGASAPEIMVNLQGDAPLTPPAFVTALVQALVDAPEVAVTTPVIPCTPEVLDRFRADRAAGRVGGTLAVLDRGYRALYFSKEVVPFGADGVAVPAFHHVGVYAFRSEALSAYAATDAGYLEGSEGLEQLRFLENAIPVQCVVQRDRVGSMFWEINNPSDVPVVERALLERDIV